MRPAMPLLCQGRSQSILDLHSQSGTDLFCAHRATFSCLGPEGRTKGWTKVKGTWEKREDLKEEEVECCRGKGRDVKRKNRKIRTEQMNKCSLMETAQVLLFNYFVVSKVWSLKVNREFQYLPYAYSSISLVIQRKRVALAPPPEAGCSNANQQIRKEQPKLQPAGGSASHRQ